MPEGKTTSATRKYGDNSEDDLLTPAALNNIGPSNGRVYPESHDITLGIEAKVTPQKIELIGESRSFAINVLAGGGVNLIKIFLQLAMLPLMAHLLGPGEFGIYALALPTVSFFMTLADGGLGASLAREPLESRDVWSSAFWLMLIVGISFSVVVAVWGFVLAQLSQEPRIAGVMALLSVIFVFVTLSVLPIARLTRERRLAVISGADLAGNLVGAVVAVFLAYYGAGAMSLAAQFVVTFFVRAVILNASAFVRPRWIFRFSALTSHISTGSSLVCGRLADFSGRLVENLVFGRSFGTSALGTYTFANQVTRFVCEAVSGPVWGALYAHALRQTDAQTERLHIRLTHLLALILSPVAFLASSSAPEVISLTLGPAWSDAATIISILIPFYALNIIAAQGGAILLAKGLGWTNFYLTCSQVVARVCVVILGLWFGLIVVAWALAGTMIFYSLLVMIALQRLGISTIAAHLRAILAPAVAGMLAGLACHFVLQTPQIDILRIFIAFVAGGLTYVFFLVILEGRRLWSDVTSFLRIMRQG